MAVLWAALCFPASAAPLCLPAADFEAQLDAKYQERPAYRGVTRGGALLRVFVSETGETWTISVQLPNGLVCLLSAGEAWRELDDAGSET